MGRKSLYKRMDGKKILYSLNVNDAQDVAGQEFDKVLTDAELETIQNTIGDYIDWYSAMICAIQGLKFR